MFKQTVIQLHILVCLLDMCIDHTACTLRRILQQHLDKVTLDQSKGRFFIYVFFGLGVHETKVRNVQFHNFLLEI